MTEKKALIFCSASYNIDPKYNQAAREFVRAACLHGYTIVSGGTVKGTMGVVGDAVAEFGGRHIGIIPRFMEKLVHPSLDEVIWTDTMSERKVRMLADAAIAVTLPGGAGTLDEFFEAMTLAKLGYFDGRLVVYNIDGFYEPLKHILDHFVEAGTLDSKDRDLVEFPETLDEIISCL